VPAGCGAGAGATSRIRVCIGTLEPEKSFLEKVDPAERGKYLHNHIFLKTAAEVEYECVIDVNDLSPTVPLTYRIDTLPETSASDPPRKGVPKDSSGFRLPHGKAPAPLAPNHPVDYRQIAQVIIAEKKTGPKDDAK
jgi:hypothetical protein